MLKNLLGKINFFAKIKVYLDANPQKVKFIGIIALTALVPLTVLTALTVQNLKQHAGGGALIILTDKDRNALGSTSDTNVFVDINLNATTEWVLPSQPSAFNINNLVENVYASESATSTPTPTPTCIRKGDANGDGTIDMSDVNKVERIILGLDSTTDGADANNDGTVNMGDVTKIERYILGHDTPPACKVAPTNTPTATPTPPPGCFYQQVQCVTIPCDPILVCATPTPTSIPASDPTLTPTPAPKILRAIYIENLDSDGSTGGSAPVRITVNKEADITHIPWKINDLSSDQTQAYRTVKVTLIGDVTTTSATSTINLIKTATPTPTSTPISACNVYTYQDKYYYGVGRHCLDKITIQGVYFVAKNQITGIKTYWKDNMLDIFTQIKNFYEGQFINKIQININTPIIVYGDRNIEEYDQSTIEQEARQKVQLDTANDFTVLMLYPIQGEDDKHVVGNFGGGGESGNSSSAMNSWFWLDPKFLGTVTAKGGSVDYTGYLGSAHEFGHSLGIPHPWEEEINKDSKGNIIDPNYGNYEIGSLMSYAGQKGPLIPNSFIRTAAKQKMIVQQTTPPTPTPTPLTIDLSKSRSSSYTITPGTIVALNWSFNNANSCEAKEDWSGPLEISGSKIVTILKSKNFFAIQCHDLSGQIFSNNTSIYVESIPPTQPESSLAIRKNLKALIIFTNPGEQMPDAAKNDLCESPSTNGFSYLPTWFQREASRYGILLSMTIQCYNEQITLPSDVISTTDTYNAFGQAIPVPLDMAKTTDYLFKTIPSLVNYDLITVLHYRTEGAAVADLAPQKINYVFLTKRLTIDGKQQYLTDGTLDKGVAHESLHNLGALDHYDYNNPVDCLTESDKTIQFTSQRVMCAFSTIDFQSMIIPQETAREIGWLKESSGSSASTPASNPALTKSPTANINYDFNNDKVVNCKDAKIILNQIGQKGSSLPNDFDHNGIVDPTDYNTVMRNFTPDDTTKCL